MGTLHVKWRDQVHALRVCWDDDKCAETLARWPGGVIELERIFEHESPSTVLARMFIVDNVLKLAGERAVPFMMPQQDRVALARARFAEARARRDAQGEPEPMTEDELREVSELRELFKLGGPSLGLRGTDAGNFDVRAERALLAELRERKLQREALDRADPRAAEHRKLAESQLAREPAVPEPAPTEEPLTPDEREELQQLSESLGPKLGALLDVKSERELLAQLRAHKALQAIE